MARGDETRASALAVLLADPEVRKQVGAAWPLYVLMVAGWGGIAEGTRDEIGNRIRESGRNAGNWIDVLVNNGIAKKMKQGRRMKVELVGEHMRVAKLPDAVTVVNKERDDEPKLDEDQKRVLMVFDNVRAMGGKIRITTEVDV